MALALAWNISVVRILASPHVSTCAHSFARHTVVPAAFNFTVHFHAVSLWPPVFLLIVNVANKPKCGAFRKAPVAGLRPAEQ